MVNKKFRRFGKAVGDAAIRGSRTAGNAAVKSSVFVSKQAVIAADLHEQGRLFPNQQPRPRKKMKR